MSFLMSATIWALSPWARTASKECCWMGSSRRAGCPRRRTRALEPASLSTRLSTATLDGAQHRTCVGRNQGIVTAKDSELLQQQCQSRKLLSRGRETNAYLQGINH